MEMEEFVKIRKHLQKLIKNLETKFYKEHGVPLLAKALGVSYYTARKLIDNSDFIPKRGRRASKVVTPNEEKFYNKYQSGQTLAEIAEENNISRERVRQIIIKYERKSGVEKKCHRYKGRYLIEKTCAQCGVVFKPKRINKEKYCSPECGRAHRGDRLKLKLPEQQIIEEYQSGFGYQRLSKKYGCSFSTIQRIIQRNGITPHIPHSSNIQPWGAKPVDYN